jgi:hypothetical protein
MKLGNKITKSHVDFKTVKMKTKLAVQIFSKSSADFVQFAKDMGIH